MQCTGSLHRCCDGFGEDILHSPRECGHGGGVYLGI